VSPDDIRDLFAVFGPITVRRMFGGVGIFADGVMFGLIARGEIYLKADVENEPAFEREGLAPFTYATKNGTRGLMSYRRMPERLYDNPEELAIWARKALAAARRGVSRSSLRRQGRPGAKATGV
jgi:DNA transformation protein